MFPKQLRFDPSKFTVTYGAPIEKYAQTTASVDGVSSFFTLYHMYHSLLS
jgi:hypothetical protein